MDNQLQQKQTKSNETSSVFIIELERRAIDTTNFKANEESGHDGNIQTSTTDSMATISNCKKRGMAEWVHLIYKSLTHMRRSSQHISESRNELESKKSWMGQHDEAIEKKHRIIEDICNDTYGSILREMGNSSANTERRNKENIHTMESENPKIQKNRDNSNFDSVDSFFANIATQPVLIEGTYD
ncbi:MAG: hypothetical protein EZS28_027614 [Streblomastix strix]|uniref:Uncharacterized protein n=1 Tax=Streblomastix strix TaxID=222440 RepID=A0A5J4V2C1_9EUKA|nr:MAG: hypothetical protein EZS28_027614 [Streblomastix strix]